MNNLNWCAIKNMTKQVLNFLFKVFVFIATFFFTLIYVLKPLYLWYAVKYFSGFSIYGHPEVDHERAIMILFLLCCSLVVTVFVLPWKEGYLTLKEAIVSWYQMEEAICKANSKLKVKK